MRNFRHNWLNLARGTISFIIKRRSGWPVPAVAATVAVGRIIILYFYYRSTMGHELACTAKLANVGHVARAHVFEWGTHRKATFGPFGTE